ncbi:proteoglycan 4-like [Uranotaenia lowii]|uniref:proteoglycan 4-like n=1 Tax=Uranotaenia lowii TaxID=190385 RepID=UPI0024792325|nr:proteoglycan 4-like [Uranotaenia lowii]
MKTHISNPVLCGICNKTFLRKDLLTRHMRSKHPNELLQKMDAEDTISIATEKTDEVEFEGEVYEITPLEDIQIVKLSSETVSLKKEHSNEIKTVDVVEIVSSEIEPRHRQREVAKKTSPLKQQTTSQTSPVFKTPESIAVVKKTALKKPTSTKTLAVAASSGVTKSQPSPVQPKPKPLPTLPTVPPKVAPVKSISAKPAPKATPPKPVSTIENAPKLTSTKVTAPKPASKKATVPKPTSTKTTTPKPASTKTNPHKSVSTKTISPEPPVTKEPESLIVVSLPSPSQAEVDIPPVETKKKRKRDKSTAAKDVEIQPPVSRIKVEEPDDGMPIFLNDSMLKEKVGELLQVLIDEETLSEFGWPNAPVEQLLSNIIVRCGHKPAGAAEAGDAGTRLRENTKILFSLTMEDDHVKVLLNNQTVDEVIMNVLKSK